MKAETQIRNLRREMKEEHRRCVEATKERDIYRSRATKAEQEGAEWKARFDVLLRREDGSKP